MKQKKASTTSERIAAKRKKKELFPYKIVSVLCVCAFLGLIAYMVYFQVYESEDLLNSPYNKRSEKQSEKVVRGSILASDGTVLARTDTDSEGNETRVYPYGSLFAHTVGYLDYGSSGLELSMNNKLLTSHDDISTQVSNELKDAKKKGDNVVTTFNVTLQQNANDILGDNHGAVFVMDSHTGAVLADVSKPSFDPNTIVSDWTELTSEENESSGVFLNRATQGLYPPGSTFKIVTALAYLRQFGNFSGFEYTCEGEYEHADYTIHCAGNEAHGTEDFKEAMANSCNCAFAYMATELIDRKTLISTAESLGFNKKPDLDLPASTSKFTLEENSADQLTMQTGIGQGNTLTTPMQMAMITQAVANDGVMMNPQFVSRIENADGDIVKTMSSSEAGTVMTSNEVSSLTDIMKAVVQEGTASALSDLPYDIAGKTGTAQYGDVSNGTSHSWFTGFSNTGTNDIVVCVLVEDGGTNDVSAYRMAGKIFAAWFDSQ